MEVQDAIKAAKAAVAEMFKSDHATNIGLEEIEYDELGKAWNVTVGFSRPWDDPYLGIYETAIASSRGHGPPAPRRTYKRVTLAEPDGKLISITNRNV